MAFERKEGQGALFRNTRKSSENSPDYTGSALIGGVEHRIAGWLKEGKSGKFLSLSIAPDSDRPKRGEAVKKLENMPDDIPW